MPKKYNAKKPERYQAIGFRPSRKLVVVLAILISLSLVAGIVIPAIAGLASGGSGSAIAQYRDYLKDNPDDVATRENLGHALFDEANQAKDDAKYEEAVVEYNKVLEKQPDNKVVLGNLAIIKFYTGKTDEAITVAERALKADPEFHITRMNLGIFLGDGKQNYAKAVEELEKIPASFQNYQNVQDMITRYKSSLGGLQLQPQGPDSTGKSTYTENKDSK